MNILVTGGAGFIGSNFVTYMLEKYPHYHIVNYDALTYAGSLSNLDGIKKDSRHTFVHGDITDSDKVERTIKAYKIDSVIHFAAESHVERSVHNPGIFMKTNIIGTQVLLEAAHKHGVSKFVQISTDEVYGSLGETGCFTEESKLRPNNPYSASKAGADLVVRSYFETYQMDVNITRCSNNYGPYQHVEKLIPRLITEGYEGRLLPIEGDGENIRDWLHVFDHCTAVDLVLHTGKAGEIYNIGGNAERRNIEVALLVAKKLGISPNRIAFVPDRLSNDRRYAIDASKLKNQLGWAPVHPFELWLDETVEWYLERFHSRQKQPEYN